MCVQVRLLNITVPLIDPSLYIHRFASKVQNHTQNHTQTTNTQNPKNTREINTLRFTCFFKGAHVHGC
eukprot:COSAG05_NODE_538_length_8854_cov_306.308738_12_plen_68_part_00